MKGKNETYSSLPTNKLLRETKEKKNNKQYSNNPEKQANKITGLIKHL
jgi:hypothetical protein